MKRGSVWLEREDGNQVSSIVGIDMMTVTSPIPAWLIGLPLAVKQIG
jgi:hypothetical protein